MERKIFPLLFTLKNRISKKYLREKFFPKMKTGVFAKLNKGGKESGNIPGNLQVYSDQCSNA